MAFTDGVVLPDLLELSSGEYVVAPAAVFSVGVELPDLLDVSSGNYVSEGVKAFTAGIELPDLLGVSSGNYVSPEIKVFHASRDLIISIRPFVEGDDSIEIIMGMYLDFEAIPRSGRAPLDVVFVNKSSNFFTNWKWDFGDGNTSIALNPRHTYKLPGKYDVGLSCRLYPDRYSTIKRG